MTRGAIDQRERIVTYDACKRPFAFTPQPREVEGYRAMVRLLRDWGVSARPSRKRRPAPHRKVRRIYSVYKQEPIKAETSFITPLVAIRAASKRASLDAELKGIFDRLSEMKKIEDVDDEYTLKPTPRAHSDTKVAIMDARDRMGEKFPLPRLVPDGDGGIVAAWSKGEKRVRLRIRADKETRDYIYYQSVDEYDVEPVTNQNLAKRLEWLLSE